MNATEAALSITGPVGVCFTTGPDAMHSERQRQDTHTTAIIITTHYTHMHRHAHSQAFTDTSPPSQPHRGWVRC